MLERFHVPHDIAVKVKHKEIFSTTLNISLCLTLTAISCTT